jgi:hypothetical protein
VSCTIKPSLGIGIETLTTFIRLPPERFKMGVRLLSMRFARLLTRFLQNQSKINLNDNDEVPISPSNWLTRQWDDGTGKLNNKQYKLGFKENLRLGYRNKKLD